VSASEYFGIILCTPTAMSLTPHKFDIGHFSTILNTMMNYHSCPFTQQNNTSYFQMQRTSVLVYIHNKIHVTTIIVQRTHTPSYTKTENQRPFPATRAVTQGYPSSRALFRCIESKRESRINNTALKNVNRTHLNESICHQQNFRSSESSQSVTDDSLFN